ncbi:helix-turn-helix domain-containing protein [Jannaschia donghaensis]|uniref:Putative transcriptional regulator n=1 Tax=Jannaschia donghaensis TaxID=420998 RepID=A0A0M6YQ06_9RHOB|nr:helix-turn-helix transcriptional regulator [Jannaschia donghaensis]CTQ51337.1 putative transcriptional regulator [Jannaschia donghaensis]
MAVRKLYAGAKLREVRTRIGLTQTDFAVRLGISLPYLNQMENNNRPVSTAVVLALAREFGFDVTELGAGDDERLVSDMREALADPVFTDAVPMADLRLTGANAPALARAFLTLHRAHREGAERLASLDAALGLSGTLAPSPWEEVRDFFHYCDNYIDTVDRAAEAFATHLGPDLDTGLATWWSDRNVAVTVADAPRLRQYDRAARHLSLSTRASAATNRFQQLHQVALNSQADLLDATLDLARFSSDDARAIARTGLANYFAGAVLMPYEAFRAAADAMRHDLERLARQFGASLEQVAHRLSTLQRTGAKGVPFFFVRVDQAGQITKRHSATRLQFARFGGACPLWNVHAAFATPGRFLRQLAETPDGARYFCLARDISSSGGAFGAPTRRHAIALGCDVRHAPRITYADGLDLSATFEPIGISCRICERVACHQRAVPPLERPLKIDPDDRGLLPYDL